MTYMCQTIFINISSNMQNNANNFIDSQYHIRPYNLFIFSYAIQPTSVNTGIQPSPVNTGIQPTSVNTGILD